MPKQLTVSDDVMGVLRRSQLTHDRVQLPKEILPRPLYIRVNQILEAAGGRWDRKAKAHVFPHDPRPVLGIAVESGAISFTDRKQEYQQFFTPPGLAARVVEEAEVARGMSVLEPSAGAGALAGPVSSLGARLTCVEIDPELAEALRRRGYSPVHTADFLQWQNFGLFDRVVMNPPFTRNQDIQHVSHAFAMLKGGGRLVSIMSPHFTFASDHASLAFREMVTKHGFWKKLPDCAFAESGTNVNTVLVVLDKPEA